MSLTGEGSNCGNAFSCVLVKGPAGAASPLVANFECKNRIAPRGTCAYLDPGKHLHADCADESTNCHATSHSRGDAVRPAPSVAGGDQAGCTHGRSICL